MQSTAISWTMNSPKTTWYVNKRWRFLTNTCHTRYDLLSDHIAYDVVRADLAQLVEQLPRKEQVTGSNPVVGSIHLKRECPGSVQLLHEPGLFTS